MDQAAVIPLIQKKHGFRVSPDDPIWLLGTVAENVQKEALAELKTMLTEQLDQITAANIQIETTAKAKAEKIITHAAAWAEKRIKDAGEAATAAMIAAIENARSDAKKQLTRVTFLALLCAAGCFPATVGTVVMLWFW
jgi:hypothetical protein